MSEQRKITAWMNLPRSLQHQYFENAAQEAVKAERKILGQIRRMELLRPYLDFEPLPDDDDWRDWRIAAVDGSYSPNISERIGIRQGVYQAGYMSFKGQEFIKDEYFSGALSEDQIGTPYNTELLLVLLCIKLERKIALSIINDVDLVLIDGSFFGFRVRCNEIREKELNLGQWKIGSELVDEIRDMSIELLNSKKAIGIVKRVRTNAIDGWSIYKNGNEENCINRNDRFILNYLMPENSWFTYRSLLGSLGTFAVFNRFRSRHRHWMRRKRVPSDYLLSDTKDQVFRNVKRNLDVPSDLIETTRYYLNMSKHNLPMCIETHKDLGIARYLAYLRSDLNPATGLPFPLDLIDYNITIPAGFIKEFSEEIYGILLRDHKLDPDDLLTYFSSINPQKEE